MNNEHKINALLMGSKGQHELRETIAKMLNEHKKGKEIAVILGVSEGYVSNVRKLLREGGESALEPKKRGRPDGKNSVLTAEQERQIKETILDSTPDKIGFKEHLWTRNNIHQLIKDKCGFEIKLSTLGHYLSRWGFTVKRPKTNEWLDSEIPEITKRAGEEDAEIYFGDAANTEAEKVKIAIFSAVSKRGKMHFLLCKSGINAKNLIDFMERLIADSEKKVFLAFENLPLLHAQNITNWLEKHKDNITLFFPSSETPEYYAQESFDDSIEQSEAAQSQQNNHETIKQNQSTVKSATALPKQEILEFPEENKNPEQSETILLPQEIHEDNLNDKTSEQDKTPLAEKEIHELPRENKKLEQAEPVQIPPRTQHKLESNNNVIHGERAQMPQRNQNKFDANSAVKTNVRTQMSAKIQQRSESNLKNRLKYLNFIGETITPPNGKNDAMCLCIVVPCYNKEYAISSFYFEILRILPSLPYQDIKFLFVDDGSTDNTLAVIKQLAASDKRVQYISFSRDFGRESAIFAGLQHSKERFVVVMDADLQDPPSLLPEMYNTVLGGEFDSVAAYCSRGSEEPPFRSFFERKLYQLITKISKIELTTCAKDYRFMTRSFVDSILAMKGHNRFSNGLFSWIGFTTNWVEFENAEHVAREGKWSPWKLLKYAISNSSFQLSIFAGVVIFLFSIATIAYEVTDAIIVNYTFCSSTLLISTMFFVVAIILIALGVIGRHLNQISQEAKQEPTYVIGDTNIELESLTLDFSKMPNKQ